MLEYIYVCRHGFRANWVDENIKTSATGMPRDPPLAAYGLDQANQLSTFLSSPSRLDPYPVPERVFSSPFYRCIQTAVPTSIALKSGGKVVDAGTLGRAETAKTDEEVGLGPGGVDTARKGEGVLLEHGVMEWYSPTRPNTGLHPRPSSPSDLSTLFPGQIDTSYTSTLFPSRSGELMRDLHDRADLFIEAWTARVEEMGFRSVVVFGHAASVIALGRALTGDKSLEVSAGCASCSLYRRRTTSSSRRNSGGGYGADNAFSYGMENNRSTSSLGAASGLLQLSKAESSAASGGATSQNGESLAACGVGEWEPVWLGRADYLDKGVERDWSLRDAVIKDGEVISDDGDHRPHPPEDTIPVGLAPGMEKYLRRGWPSSNVRGIKEVEEAIKADSQGAASRGKM